MISVLIADDEAPARDELSFLLRQDERVGEILQAASGAEAIQVLSRSAVDAVLLDIHMPGLSGFDLARTLGHFGKRPALVFVTADDDGAVDAFDLDAVDYVLKPVRRERLERAIGRVLEANGTSRPAASDGTEDLIAVTVGSTTRMIRRRDVRYAQAQGDYVRLFTDQGAFLVRIPLAELELAWAGAFVRIHRSYLIALTAAQRMRLTAGQGSVTVSVAGKSVDLPVSRRMLPTLRERVAQTRPKAAQ
ncbi:MAG TPA: LytTR family DNA-binding domain-containing protein [Microbacteriaceae bacterium]|nr:LytTR family DNA-binding domain-containing protein [Microbacteriaceae bacterium]